MMMDIRVYPLTPEHEKWQDLIRFAQSSAWQAGPALADMMRNTRFTDWERVFAVEIHGNIVGYCDFTRYDEMPAEYGFTPFIGFVYVDEKARGHRLSQALIEGVMRYAGSVGFDRVYLMSGEKGLYEKYGFEKIGEYRTIYGTVDQLFVRTV